MSNLTLSKSAFFSGLMSLLLLTSPNLAFAKSFTSNHASLYYTGRIAVSEQGHYLTWPGSQIEFLMSGDKLVLELDDAAGNNYFNVIVNHQSQFPFVLAAQKGNHSYDLSHMLKAGQNHIKIFKRTEGAEGGTYFKNIELSDDGQLHQITSQSTLKMTFYGDSITVGMGNEAAHNALDNKPSEKNHYLSYAAITARNLDAEFHTIAKSGIGFLASWFDFTMPEYYDQITAESNNNSSWNFQQWLPDVVVVNLGQNDSWLLNSDKGPSASPKEIINGYKRFIKSLHDKHPSALFICALGSMDATKDKVWPSYIAQAVSELKQELVNINIDTITFRFNGYKQHPRVEQHHQNAEHLSQFIKNKLNL